MSENDSKNSSSMNFLKKKFKASDAPGVDLTDEESEEGEHELLDHPSYKELQNKLTEAEKGLEAAKDKALRIQADLENISRRTERDVANAHKYALEKFSQELLPVIDNLERAVQTSEESETPAGVFDGVHLTLKLFYSVLEKFGIEQVNPVKELFNPELHQAISTQADPNVPPNTVLTVLQKGYLLNKRLIRPALVVVSKA